MRKILIVFVLLIFSIFVYGKMEKQLYPINYKDSVLKYSKQYKLEPELVFAIIKAESGFNKDAISRKRAIGLMQLMNDTAESGAKNNGIDEYNENMLFVPEINIQLGCWHLSKLFSEHISMPASIAAYNAGGKNIKSWFNNVNYQNLSKEEFSKNIRFPETKNFVKRVINNYKQYKKIYACKLEV